MKSAFKIGKAKKIKVNEVPHIVLKLSGKIPAKLVRELKAAINNVVQQALQSKESLDS